MANDVDWSALDYDNPCGLLEILRPKYMALLAGEAVQEIEIDGRRMKMTPTSLPALEITVNRLSAECSAKSTGRRVRRAAVSRHF